MRLNRLAFILLFLSFFSLVFATFDQTYFQKLFLEGAFSEDSAEQQQFSLEANDQLGFSSRLDADHPFTPFENSFILSYYLNQTADVEVELGRILYDMEAFNFLNNLEKFRNAKIDVLPEDVSKLSPDLRDLLDVVPVFEEDYSNVKQHDGSGGAKNVLYAKKAAKPTRPLTPMNVYWKGVGKDGFIQNGVYAVTVRVSNAQASDIKEHSLVVSGAAGIGQYAAGIDEKVLVGGRSISIKTVTTAEDKVKLYLDESWLTDLLLGAAYELENVGTVVITKPEGWDYFVVSFKPKLSEADARKIGSLLDHGACKYSYSQQLLSTLSEEEAALMCSPSSKYCWGAPGIFCFAGCGAPGYRAADAIACCKKTSPAEEWGVADEFKQDLVLKKVGKKTFCDCPPGFEKSGVGCAKAGEKIKLPEEKPAEKIVTKEKPAAKFLSSFRVRVNKDRFEVLYWLSRKASVEMSVFDSDGKKVLSEQKTFSTDEQALQNPHSYSSALGYGTWILEIIVRGEGVDEKETQKIIIPKPLVQKKKEHAVKKKTPPVTTAQKKITHSEKEKGCCKAKLSTKPPVGIFSAFRIVSGERFEGRLSRGGGIDFTSFGTRVVLVSVSAKKHVFNVIKNRKSVQCVVTAPGANVCQGVTVSVAFDGSMTIFKS